ncbi:MAG: hypothetical protein ACXABY_13080 [Candidatus Thorarchaeota archaeon]|jgi:hypothetical protein
MREGVRNDRSRSDSQYNPDRSYELASWEDYEDWLKRCEFEAEYIKGEGMKVIGKLGDVYMLPTKKDVYIWLLESDGNTYV